MNSEVIKINCFNNDRLFAYFLKKKIQVDVTKLDDYKFTRLTNLDLIVDFTINRKNVRVNMTTEAKTDIHVCMISGVICTSNYFRVGLKRQANSCKKAYPTAPIIILGYNDGRKHEPDEMKEIELEGDKMMNSKIGAELANEIGAVKYIECSRISGRGIKILLDEIALAGLGKMIDERLKKEAKVKFLRVLLDAVLNFFYYL